MWKFRKYGGSYSIYQNRTPRDNVKWDMLTIVRNGYVGKYFDSDASEWMSVPVLQQSYPAESVDTDKYGDVYAIHYGGDSNFYKVSWKDQSIVWSKEIGSAGAPQSVKTFDNYVYVGAYDSGGASRLSKYDLDGNLVMGLTAPGNIRCIDVDESGSVYASCVGGYICKWDSSGSVIWETIESAGAKCKLYGIYFYVAGEADAYSSAVRVFNQSDGSLAARFGVDAYTNATSIDVYSGQPLVGYEDNTWRQYTSGYSLLRSGTWSGIPNVPIRSVSYNRFGEFFVSGDTAPYIRKFSATGSLVYSFPNSVLTPRDMKAQFNY